MKSSLVPPARTSPVALAHTLLAAVPRGRGRFALATLLAMLASMSSVALMGTSAWLISFAAWAPPVLYLQVPAVLVRAFGISRGVFRYLERLVGHDLVLRMQSVLRLRIYDKLAGTTLIGKRRGDLLTRVVADVSAIQDLIVRVAIPVLSASLLVIATTSAFSLISPAAAFWLLMSALLGGVIAPLWAQRASERIDLASAPTRGQLADNIRQFVRTAPDLVAYGAVDRALEATLAADAELCRQDSRAAWIRGVAGAGQVLAAGGAVVAALLVGAPAVAAGQLDPRFLAVVVLTPLAMHEVFATFAQAAQTFTRSRAALLRVGETLDAPAVGTGDVLDGEGDIKGLELRSVSVGWPGSSPVQTGLSLRILPGDRIAMVGPSGSGKTTVAATVLGLIPPLTGTIRRGGRVGYLAQDAHIFTTSVAENVRIGNRDATDEQIAQALADAGLEMDPDRLVGEGGHDLSGGERRRLAFARVLVSKRDVMILDEPTEHLDRETADRLVDDMLAVTGDVAILVMTHDAEVVRRLDSAITLVEPGVNP